jgi:hypothetical protein
MIGAEIAVTICPMTPHVRRTGPIKIFPMAKPQSIQTLVGKLKASPDAYGEVPFCGFSNHRCGNPMTLRARDRAYCPGKLQPIVSLVTART